MRDLRRDIQAFGGLARRRDLLALGHSRAELGRAVASGQLRVPLRGWVADAAAHANAVRAVALGGRLGGTSALQLRGIWVDETGGLVVACRPGASRLPELRDSERRVYCKDRFPERGSSPWTVSVRDAIVQHSMCASLSEMVAVIDSALHLRLLGNRQVAALLQALPARVRPNLSDLDGKSMAGTESHLRFALRRAGYRVQTQQRIAGVGIVDLLVDEWFITECDSREFHGGEAPQEVDRRRDGNAALIGHPNARFTYAQVMFDRDWCVRVVEAGLLRGRPPTSFNRTGGR